MSNFKAATTKSSSLIPVPFPTQAALPIIYQTSLFNTTPLSFPYSPPSKTTDSNPQLHPTEVKHLKQLVRNIIDPSRDLGHVDRHSNPAPSSSTTTTKEQTPPPASQAPTSNPTANPPQALSAEDPKASVPQGLHIAPAPTPQAPNAGSEAAVPRDEKIVSDESASRKETVTVTDADAGLVKEVREARGGEK